MREATVCLPKHVPRSVTSALVHVIALARTAIADVHGGLFVSPILRVRLRARINRLENEVAQLREQIRIKDSRMARIDPRKRPHYAPEERLAILTLRAAVGWSAAETARIFLLTASTIADWSRTLYRDGAAELVAPRAPVNRFADFVDLVVQHLHHSFPAMGCRRIARTLARAGLHLSATTVRRICMQPKPLPTCTQPLSRTAGRQSEGLAVTACYPHHVWHVDLTLVPTFAGFWVPWLPNAVAQCWPFCWHVAVVVDHFSRAVVYTCAYPSAPSAPDICRLLEHAIASAGEPPRHIVTDKGSQFRDTYLDWCAERGIRPRFGAVGRKGSIAVVERFIRTMKDEHLRRMLVPMRLSEMDRALRSFACWYNVHRPHETLGGATPAEIRAGRLPAHQALAFETRSRHPLRGKLSRRRGIRRVQRVRRLELVVEHFDGNPHLPATRTPARRSTDIP